MAGPDVACTITVEGRFGPIVSSPCLRGFDFTLLFEEAILTIVPLSIAILWCLCRFSALRNATAKAKPSWLLTTKLVFYAYYIAIQATSLAIWITADIPRTRLTIACISLSIFGFIILSLLSILEHIRSIRPSTPLATYMGLSVLLDLPRLRTLFYMPGCGLVSKLLLAGYCLKIIIFCLETTEKGRLLLPDVQDASPEARGSVYNRGLFIWLNQLFVKGFRSHLTVDSLTALDDEILAASRPTTLERCWSRAAQSNKDALLWAFLTHYKWVIMSGVLPRLAFAGFTFAQPYLVQRVLDFTAKRDILNANDTSYALIGAYAIVYIGTAVSYTIYQHKTYRLLTMFRGSLISLIYGKTLRIPKAAAAEAEAITLMSADIDRIGFSIPLLHETYSSFIDAGLCLWLLYQFLGVAMVAPIIWIIVCLAIGIPISNAAGNAQLPWLDAIEDRLAVTAKALGVMKPTKMTGLTNMISSKIGELRTDEIRAARKYRFCNVFVAIISFASSALAPVWGYGLYILLAKSKNEETLTDGIAFAALSLFETLNQPLNFLMNAVEDTRVVINSFRRIQEYLLSDEQADYRNFPVDEEGKQVSCSSSSLDCKSPANEFEKCNFPLVSHGKPVISISNASASYDDDDSDPVLRDLTFNIPDGKISMIFGPVGCGKSTLLKLLLGEVRAVSGSVLVQYAKAAYCPQSPWTTRGTIRSNILGMGKWDKSWYDTVTHACMLLPDLEQLPDGDHTDVGTRGSRLSGGQRARVALARALYSRNQLMILDDVFAGLDRTTEKHVLDHVFGPQGIVYKLGSTVVLATNSALHLQFSDHVIVLGEDGQILKQGSPECQSDDESIQKLEKSSTSGVPKPEEELPAEVLEEIEALEHQEADASRKTGDIKIYVYYARIAGWWLVAGYLLACAAFVFGVSFPSIWLQKWTNANASHPNERIGYWLGVYAALGIITMLGCVISDCVFNLMVVPKTSKRFHQLLLDTTMNAPISFLTSTDAGVTVNRFSQDLELIDNDLPKSLDSLVFQFISAVVSSALVFVGSGYIAATLPLCILCLGGIQYYYLKTSRQLRLLDIEAKAPLFSHFLETVDGVSCIRAYGWSEQYAERGYEILNASQKPYYLLWCIQRWLTLVLDLFVAGLAILLVALATNLHSGTAGFLGVALFNIVTFSSTLQTLITEWTQVETAIGAINRIRSYVGSVKNENLPTECGEVPTEWPASGEIVFKDVFASYDTSNEPVLKQCNISIKPGEKVAICGRTGSGKSSLISTLLRLLEIESGSITIDDIDISTIPREEVRQRLNTLPQEPFFLHGSVRENMDPMSVANDEDLVEALRSVHLWDIFASQEGLDGEFSEDALSHGQRQLFCLARAVVRPCRILIMDEASSSVDAESDELLQRIVREKFAGQTILSVAHKLDAIMDYDKVIMLDRGEIVELGKPRELLNDATSRFYALYTMKTDVDS